MLNKFYGLVLTALLAGADVTTRPVDGHFIELVGCGAFAGVDFEQRRNDRFDFGRRRRRQLGFVVCVVVTAGGTEEEAAKRTFIERQLKPVEK